MIDPKALQEVITYDYILTFIFYCSSILVTSFEKEYSGLLLYHKSGNFS